MFFFFFFFLLSVLLENCINFISMYDYVYDIQIQPTYYLLNHNADVQLLYKYFSHFLIIMYNLKKMYTTYIYIYLFPWQLIKWQPLTPISHC